MRRFTFTMALVAIFLMGVQQSVNAQGVRNDVLVEIFGGTWCTYCPGSALGADDLIHNGHSVAIFEHHIGDGYEITETDQRDTWYAVGGYPTTWWDGKEEQVGGNASSTIYPSYLPRYNSYIAATTPYNLSMMWTQTGNDIYADIVVNQVGTSSASNLSLGLGVTESHIPDNWLAGLTEVNFVTRTLHPDWDGTSFTVSQGNPYIQVDTITLNPAWIQSNMEIIAFVQDLTTKEVFNSAVQPLQAPTGQFDPELVSVTNPLPAYTCATSHAPEITVKNLGSDDITAMTITYDVNGGTASTYNWTGTLGWGGITVITLPSISFTPNPANNTLSLDITNVNSGSTDADMNNNSASFGWNYEEDAGEYTFSITTDNYGYETYWEILDGNNTVLASGGNTTLSGGPTGNSAGTDPGAYGNAMTFTEKVMLPINDCYTVRIVDDYEDGICCAYGNGHYDIYDPYGNMMMTGGSFAGEEIVDWHTNATVALRDRLDDEVALYPNPNNGQFTLQIGEGFSSEATVSVLSLDGREVFRTNTNNNVLKVDVSDLASGMYMVKIQSEEGTAVKKMTIK